MTSVYVGPLLTIARNREEGPNPTSSSCRLAEEAWLTAVEWAAMGCDLLAVTIFSNSIISWTWRTRSHLPDEWRLYRRYVEVDQTLADHPIRTGSTGIEVTGTALAQGAKHPTICWIINLSNHSRWVGALAGLNRSMTFSSIPCKRDRQRKTYEKSWAVSWSNLDWPFFLLATEAAVVTSSSAWGPLAAYRLPSPFLPVEVTSTTSAYPFSFRLEEWSNFFIYFIDGFVCCLLIAVGRGQRRRPDMSPMTVTHLIGWNSTTEVRPRHPPTATILFNTIRPVAFTTAEGMVAVVAMVTATADQRRQLNGESTRKASCLPPTLTTTETITVAWTTSQVRDPGRLTSTQAMLWRTVFGSFYKQIAIHLIHTTKLSILPRPLQAWADQGSTLLPEWWLAAVRAESHPLIGWWRTVGKSHWWALPAAAAAAVDKVALASYHPSNNSNHNNNSSPAIHPVFMKWTMKFPSDPEAAIFCTWVCVRVCVWVCASRKCLSETNQRFSPFGQNGIY